MTLIARGLIESGYITIDSRGWHCADDAPEEIRQEFEEFMREINSMVILDVEK